MINDNTSSYKWLPFKLLKFYTLLLLTLSIIGPVKYAYNSMYAFITVVYIIMFLLFTYAGMKTEDLYHTQKQRNSVCYVKLLNLLKASIFITLPVKVMLVLSSIQLYGMPSFSNLFATLADVYTTMHNDELAPNVYRQIDTFLTFVFYFSTFIGFYWRNKIHKMHFAIVLVNVLLDLFYQLCFIGTQRSIITIAVLLFSVFIRNSVTSNLKIDKKRMVKIIVLVLFLLFLFTNILSARKTMWNSSGRYIYSNHSFDFSHWMLFWCRTDKLKYDVCNLISYFTQGFYGLSISFQVPFEWSYMLGSFRGLNSIVSQVIPAVPDMVELTYPLRAGIQFHFDGLACWYTIFPWLASDFTFFGSLIYMALVGKLFMRCWIQSIEYDNPLAFLILVLLIIQYIFIVANNQLFVQRGESMATVVLLIVYLIFNKKYDFRANE